MTGNGLAVMTAELDGCFPRKMADTSEASICVRLNDEGQSVESSIFHRGCDLGGGMWERLDEALRDLLPREVRRAR